jgi:hypothetical protein
MGRPTAETVVPGAPGEPPITNALQYVDDAIDFENDDEDDE